MKKPDQRLRQLFALTLPVDGFTSGKNEMKQIQNWKCNLRKTPDETTSCALSLLLDRRSIDLSGAREKEGHFHYKNFLRASK